MCKITTELKPTERIIYRRGYAAGHMAATHNSNGAVELAIHDWVQFTKLLMQAVEEKNQVIRALLNHFYGTKEHDK